MGPLAGVKVLELAQIMAGPTCGMLLADLGADVIKVERIPGGDDTLKKINPALIYCSISGNGRTGPYADKGGYDLIAQGMSGLMAI